MHNAVSSYNDISSFGLIIDTTRIKGVNVKIQNNGSAVNKYYSNSTNSLSNAMVYNSLCPQVTVTILSVDYYLKTQASGNNTTYTSVQNGLFGVNYSAFHLNHLFFGGNGVSNDPYLIENIRHFNNIHFISNENNPNKDVYYKQTKGLYFGYTETRRGVSFFGNYDGNLKGILEVQITSNDPTIGGLFDWNYGTISRLSATATLIQSSASNAHVGGIVGVNYGTISGILFAVTNINAYNYNNGAAGGIAAANFGNINSSVCAGTIIAKSDVGGVTGSNSGTISGIVCSTTITYYHFGTINRSVGGLVGVNHSEIFDSTSYAKIYYGGITSVGDNNSTIVDENSRSIAPHIGRIAGFNVGAISSCQAEGSVNLGTLKVVKWTTGVWPFRTEHSWDQAQYAGNRACGYSIN